ncbi:MAG: hypothetical protein K8R67_07010 [Desulfobacteraceae bacterium]|nr:hypothetical protein [Desulfobacteraceae bacterium]
MKKHLTRIIICIVVFLLAGCATVKDIQRSTDLIRTDNELTRLLVEADPSNQDDRATYLIGIASHAKKEAESLKGIQGKRLTAIAYYRIAATAYWQSGRTEVINELFETVNKGRDLCEQMGDKGPDRDCLFLRLVIPFAGLESIAEKYLSGLLDTVDLNDGDITLVEKETMEEVGKLLRSAKGPMENILTIGLNDRLMSHPGLRDYYCKNAKKAVAFYDSRSGLFLSKVKEFYSSPQNHELSLDITVEDAQKIRKLYNHVPDFCNCDK